MEKWDLAKDGSPSLLSFVLFLTLRGVGFRRFVRTSRVTLLRISTARYSFSFLLRHVLLASVLIMFFTALVLMPFSFLFLC